MKLNKETFRNVGLMGVQSITIVLFIVSILILFSSDLQKHFKADNVFMWGIGAIFGIVYIPVARLVFEKTKTLFKKTGS